MTGSDNTAAQKLYSAIGFECDGEIHMSKQVKKFERIVGTEL